MECRSSQFAPARGVFKAALSSRTRRDDTANDSRDHGRPRPPSSSATPSDRFANGCGLDCSRSDASSFFNLLLLHLDLPNPKLLNFAAHGRRKRIHKSDALRNLEMRDTASAEFANLVWRGRLTLLQANPRKHALP